jgi:hypothetical protein
MRFTHKVGTVVKLESSHTEYVFRSKEILVWLRDPSSYNTNATIKTLVVNVVGVLNTKVLLDIRKKSRGNMDINHPMALILVT